MTQSHIQIEAPVIPPDCSVVIPVYNSEQTLPTLYAEIVQVLEGMGKSLEIVFVEDGGRDHSWEVLSRLAQEDGRVKAIQLMRNYGQANATMCGLGYASGEFVVTIDDDLQIPPSEIAVLVQALEHQREIDVIFGVPHKKYYSAWRRLGSELSHWVTSQLFASNPKVKLTSFRIIRRQVLVQLLAVKAPRPVPGALLCSITPRIANVTVQHRPRPIGAGNYTIPKLVGLLIDKTISFSTFPLRFLAISGMLGIVGSISLGLFYILRYVVMGRTLPGWLTLVLLLILFSGFNFMAFGIVGEYLLRILQCAHDTPQYLIRHAVVASESGQGAAVPAEPRRSRVGPS